MKYIIGLDVGTSGVKASVFDEAGAICRSAYREYPQKEYDGLIDAAMVWSKVKQVISECTAVYPLIAAICTTSFGETVVAVDQNGEPLAPAVLYTSADAQAQWQELDRRIGAERIAAITGHISHPMYTISRLCRIKKEQPEIYHKTVKFLFFASYIEHCLGADFVAEDTLASRSMAYDVSRGDWSREILAAADIDPEKMAAVVRAGDMIGTTTEQINRELGLTAPARLIAGGHDQPCVALGMGAIDGGDAAYGMGTVECFTLIMDEYKQSPAMTAGHLVCAPHVIPGRYLTYGVLFSGGVVLKDLRGKLYTQELAEYKAAGRNVYELMMAEMPGQLSKLLYLPHLAGSGTPYMDTADRGAVYGLTLATSRGEIVRAALEGIACDMRLNIANMEACGLPVKRILAAGGGAASRRGLQVRADLLGRELHGAVDIQAGTRGVFYIAAKAIGLIDDYQVSKKRFESYCIKPDVRQAGAAAKKYRDYQKFYELVGALKKEEEE